MAVFSTIIDELVLELVRPDLVTMLPGFLNQTIRECHHGALRNDPIFFDENRKEIEVAATPLSQNAFVWQIPVAPLFQAIDAIYFVSPRRYANLVSPQTINESNPHRPNDMFAYYRTGPAFAMRGFGAESSKVKISWFEYPRSLVYYSTSTRPLKFNVETMQYEQPQNASISLNAAMNLSTNWLIERHTEMLKEGVRAKAYARMDQEFRSSTSYSKYKTMLDGMQKAESAPQGVYKFK